MFLAFLQQWSGINVVIYYASEIYPNRIHGAAMSIGATSHWVANFLLTFSFLTIKEAIGWANNFWLYGVICLGGFIVLSRYLPETKGKSLRLMKDAILLGVNTIR